MPFAPLRTLGRSLSNERRVSARTEEGLIRGGDMDFGLSGGGDGCSWADIPERIIMEIRGKLQGKGKGRGLRGCSHVNAVARLAQNGMGACGRTTEPTLPIIGISLVNYC